MFDPVTLAGSIAGLTITGITIKDLDEIPEALQDRDCPVLIPAYDFVSNLVFTPDSMGRSVVAFETVTYNVKYFLFVRQAGMDRQLSAVMSDILSKAQAVARAVVLAGTGLGPERVTMSGGIAASQIRDYADKNTFHGAALIFSVTEYENQ